MSHPPANEAEVVYVMVEIRKMLERQKRKLEKANWRKEYFPSLSFYCDWIVHVFMDRKKAREILVDIGKNLKSNEKKFFHFLLFEDLKNELSKFITLFRLPSNIVKRDWNRFRKHLTSILKDCPLTVDKPTIGQIREFRLVSSVRLKKGDTSIFCRVSFEGENPRYLGVYFFPRNSF